MSAQRSTISSLPALAAAIRMTGHETFVPAEREPLSRRALVPMYRVANHEPDREVQDAVHVVGQVIDRLQRLGDAYGEWQDFDVGAYFDLTEPQTQALVRLVERVATVHVTVFVDLLLPSFQRASTFWAGQYSAAHASTFAQRRGEAAPAYDDDFLLDTQPEMIELWQIADLVILRARAVLRNDASFLGTSAVSEERARWRTYWSNQPGRGIAPDLRPELGEIPTLTLTYEFPLPPARQSGRIRRLRRNRERQLRRRKLD